MKDAMTRHTKGLENVYDFSHRRADHHHRFRRHVCEGLLIMLAVIGMLLVMITLINVYRIFKWALLRLILKLAGY